MCFCVWVCGDLLIYRILGRKVSSFLCVNVGNLLMYHIIMYKILDMCICWEFVNASHYNVQDS